MWCVWLLTVIPTWKLWYVILPMMIINPMFHTCVKVLWITISPTYIHIYLYRDSVKCWIVYVIWQMNKCHLSLSLTIERERERENQMSAFCFIFSPALNWKSRVYHKKSHTEHKYSPTVRYCIQRKWSDINDVELNITSGNAQKFSVWKITDKLVIISIIYSTMYKIQNRLSHYILTGSLIYLEITKCSWNKGSWIGTIGFW